MFFFSPIVGRVFFWYFRLPLRTEVVLVSLSFFSITASSAVQVLSRRRIVAFFAPKFCLG